jgi:hypothetical protein
MATSFVEYKNQGFWANDDFICVTAAFIYVSIIHQDQKPNWLVEYGEELKENSYGYFVGFTSLCLDDYIIHDNRKAILLNIINEIQKETQKKDSVIDLTYLNEYLDVDNKNIWYGVKISKDILLNMFKFIEYILNGQAVEENPLWSLRSTST